MKNKTNILSFAFKLFTCLVFILSLTACEDNKSYADLLRDEEAAVNWYLAQNRVEPRVPADSVFKTGKDAPFYRMNSEGTVYMRVISTGDMKNRPKKGETVYFRFTRYCINYMYDGKSAPGFGNSEGMGQNSASIVYGNNVLSTTTKWGAGIQVPLDYLGYDCEVDLIVKSIDGLSDDISKCEAYVYKSLKYFKAEY